MGALDVTPEDVTEGPIARTLVLLSVPLLVQNLVHVVNQIVDTFWLGRVGEAAVGAVGLDFPILAIMFGVVATGAVGTQILVAQRVGAGEVARARRLAFNGVGLSVLLGVALFAAVAVAGGSLIQLLGAGPSVAPLAAQYLFIYAAFFPLAAGSDALERAFVGWSDTRAALYVNLVMVGTNLLLDPFLVLGYGPFPALGVRGAALATGIGYTLGFATALLLASGLRDSLTLSLADARPSRTDLRALLDVGAPVSGQQLAGQTARVATVAFVPAAGFGNAAQSMVGQNLGADRPDRAHGTVRSGVRIAAGALGTVGVLQWLVPGLLAETFVPTLTETGFALTVEYLEILAYGYWAMGASAVLLAGFNGASRTRTGFVVDLLKYWGIRIPAAVAALPAAVVVVRGLPIGGLDLGVHAVFWAVTVSNVAAAVGVGAYYLWLHDRMFSNAAEEATGVPGD